MTAPRAIAPPRPSRAPTPPSLRASVGATAALAGRAARQQSLDANVFVQIGPVDAEPVSDEPPVAPLVGVGMQEPGEPRERRGNDPPVGESRRQRVGVDLDPTALGVSRSTVETIPSLHEHVLRPRPEYLADGAGEAGQRVQSVERVARRERHDGMAVAVDVDAPLVGADDPYEANAVAQPHQRLVVHGGKPVGRRTISTAKSGATCA